LGSSKFKKQWQDKFISAEDIDADFKSKVRKHGCFICHVDGEDKKKVRNEYGKAVNKFLTKKDYDEWVKADAEEAKKKIYEAFEKAGKMKSKDGSTFEEKIKNNKVPATDSGKE
jgi:hypothetical protein